jgi:hypothetical protein
MPPLNRETLIRYAPVLAFTAAWIGTWGAWIQHSASSLSQNAYYLAEWATFLPQVRFEGLRILPELIRFALALSASALLITLTDLKPVSLRTGIRLVAILPGIVLLPPYPDVMSLWGSESYGLRFASASIVLLALPLSMVTDQLTVQTRLILVSCLSIGSTGMGIWGLTTLLPIFEILYSKPVQIGWGLWLFFTGTVVGGLLLFFAFLSSNRKAQAV